MSGKLLTCWERVAASSLGDKSISDLVYEQVLDLLQARFCGTSRDANIVLCQTVGRRIWAWGQNFWFISQDHPRLLSWTFGVVTERVWSPTEATSILADPWKEDKELLHCAERNQLTWFGYLIRMLSGHLPGEIFWAGTPAGGHVWVKGRLATLLISVLPPCPRPIMAEKIDRWRRIDGWTF